MFLEQGELVWLNFNMSNGPERDERRPAVVVSVSAFNNVYTNLAVVCPIASAVSAHPLHVPLPAGAGIEGCICVEEVRAVDPIAREAVPTGESVDENTMAAALELLAGVFGV